MVFEGAREKQLEMNDRVFDQIEYELRIIDELGFTEYFLIYEKIIQVCNREGYLRSYGRGSACSSLVNFCLDITKINPLEEGLIFERFINPTLTKSVDIDIDIPVGSQRRVIQRLKKELPGYYINQLAYIPERYVEWYKKLLVNEKEYLVHPCAVIISKEKLKLPEWKEKQMNYYVIDDYKRDIEIINPIRFDVLELDYLNRLNEITKLVGAENHPYKIDLNDKKTFDFFINGDLTGIFQFGSVGCRKILKEFEPRSINDLAIINAMYRPGLIDFIPELLNRKKYGFENEFSKDERVLEVLNPTYGILIYQETFMHLVHAIAGFTYTEADYYRKILCRNKDEIKINDFRNRLLRGCRTYSKLNETQINKLESLILKMMPYSFNKSHSLSYSILGYWGAYYKAHTAGIEEYL